VHSQVPIESHFCSTLTMGCISSASASRVDHFDSCHDIVPQQPPPFRRKSRERSSSKVSLGGAWDVSADASKDPGVRTYKSYTDTPIDAPAGVSALPDRDVHDEHLRSLEVFFEQVTAEPERFKYAISMARWASFSATSHSPSFASQTSSQKIRSKVDASSRFTPEDTKFGYTDSTSTSTTTAGSGYPSERSTSRVSSSSRRGSRPYVASTCQSL
jgi:hypothetical protein